MIASVSLVEKRLKVDDPVGAVSVHGAGGLWGLLSVGIFADGSYQNVAGLIAGNPGQLVAQLITMATALVWGLGMGYLVFALLKSTMGLRASKKEEIEGLDRTEHGMDCYVFGRSEDAA